MGVGQGQALNKRQQFLHVLFGFTGKSGDNIRTQPHDRPMRAQ